MAAPPPSTSPVGPDTLITVKVIIDGQNRRFKLALRDLGANTLPQKLRFLLSIPPEVDVKFERFSDSAGTYVTLDSNNPSIYKQLYRAAKAKLKLRLKASIIHPTKPETTSVNIMDDQSSKSELDQLAAVTAQAEPRQSYLETVLTQAPDTVSFSCPPFKRFDAFPPCASAGVVPGASSNGENTGNLPARPTPRAAQLSQPTLPTLNDFAAGTFGIDCNHCGESIPNEHYHCGICEKGDFDLCQSCIDSGVICEDDGHWLIKRIIRNGIVIPSITETRPPRRAFTTETSTLACRDESEAPASPEQADGDRTCNNCINQLPGKEFVTCKACPDFDLCFACFQLGEHGHHPAHVFEPVDIRTNSCNPTIKALCGPGRGVKHLATCDGCEKLIVGVRHKCLSCPDWDFCSVCVPSAKDTHPGHRFATLYEPLPYVHVRKEIHRGIYCDGPLCAARNRKSYIRGDRYKCAVCHDTDFCANCDALPTHTHNKTHPMIKIRAPIRHVSITTFQETESGEKMDPVGDRPLAKNAATETTRTTSANAATQVHTVAEVKPAEDLAVSPRPHAPEPVASPPTGDLQAWYEADSTPDGSSFGPKRLVSQSWTLRNPGPEAWPAGCAVYYIGGDDMRNLDGVQPSSVSSMTLANRSNVLEYSLQPGKTAVFTVLLKSPAREGRAISYWRLKTPQGLPFGHKLWADINVMATPIELPIRSANPSPAPTVEKAEDDAQDGSTMIFPKLDKESPVSSVHDVAAAPSATVEAMDKDEEELVDEIENLELEDDESDEDGFLTDEEYDILDASDEDFLMEAQQGVAKK